MLYALVEPVAFAGLVLAFLVAVLLRALLQSALARWLSVSTRPRAPLFEPRRDIDPFGAVGAVLGGTGWGRPAPLPETGPRVLRPGGQAMVYAVGPLIGLLAGEAVLAGYAVGTAAGQFRLSLFLPSDVLHGIPIEWQGQLLVSFGVGLLCFGLLEIIPLPPLDGWGLLWLVWRRPGEGARKAQYWLVDRNIGVVILLVLMLPLGARGPFIHLWFDAVGGPLMRLWG